MFQPLLQPHSPGHGPGLETQAEDLIVATFQEFLQTDVFSWSDRLGWVDSSAEQRLTPAALLKLPVDELNNWSAVRRQPTLVELSPDTWLFITCVNQAGVKSRVVAGLCACRDRHMLMQQLRTVTSLIQQRWQSLLQKMELEKFAEQVSDDWEELTWLRSLSAHLEIYDVGHSLTEVMSRLLITLRELVRAEMLCYVPREAGGGESDLRQADYLCSAHAGRKILSEAGVRLLLDRLGIRSCKRPLVRNRLREELPDALFTDLRNAVVVSVCKGSRQFGWLLALNKQPIPMGGERSRTLYGEGEFGTPEAGVLSAAASLLATHATNLALFDERDTLMVGVIRAMVSSLDARDPYTCGHSERVALMAIRLAEHLKLSDQKIDELYLTGLLHDIGKLGIEDQILLKTGRLTDEEFEIIKQHPVIGYSILQHLDQLKFVLPGVLHHHEAWDGSGYPHQLEGENIPLVARILAVVDAYDAMTSTRPYRSAMPRERAQSILQSNSGSQWDPLIVEAFFACVEDIQTICSQVPRKPLQELDRLRRRRTEIDLSELAPILEQNQLSSGG